MLANGGQASRHAQQSQRVPRVPLSLLPSIRTWGLAVTCWEPEAVRSVLEAAQGWGRLCVPTAMGNHHFKALT